MTRELERLREQSAAKDQQIKQQQEQIKQQQEQIGQQQEQISQQQEQISQQQEQIGQQQERITELERQLAARKRNSTTSSKPPSSDGLAGKQRKRCSPRKKSGKKPGGQPGHTGHNRDLTDNPDRIEQVLPQECKHCGTALPQDPQQFQTMDEVVRRQITDLPEVIVPVVTEFQYPKLVCPCCHKGTRAQTLPEHQHWIGERLTAAIAHLIAVRKMTRRDVKATVEDLLGVDISVGSVQKAWEETADAVQGPYEDLEAALPGEPVLNGDETGSRTNGEKRWMWAF